jgi:hypothetical protein
MLTADGNRYCTVVLPGLGAYIENHHSAAATLLAFFSLAIGI